METSMNKFGKWVAMVAVFVSVGVSGIASATNGYFTHGTGTKNKGMAGAGMALPDDAISTVNNPAVAVLVGDKMEIGAAVFNPNRSYSTTPSLINGQFGSFTIGPNDIDSDSNYFVIPHFARSWQRDNDTAWALAFYGRGGMNTDWAGGTATFDPDGPYPGPIMTLPGTYGAGDVLMDFSQAFLDVTWAKQINERLSLGITGLAVYQIFKVKGVGSFAGYTQTFSESGGTVFPTNLTDNGHDGSYGFGLRLGLHSQMTDALSFGVSYQMEISMAEFDDYSDLFAEQGGMDIPANLKLGLAYQVDENVAVTFDIEHIWYSDIASVNNSITNLFSCPPFGTDFSRCLGGDNGGGFGWEDMTVYKLGAEWGTSEDWTWRAGYSFGDQPIPNTEMTFNILAPGVMESHFTFGFTKVLESGNDLNFSFMYAPKESVTGANNFDPTQNITFEMNQFEVELSYGWKF
jgi:long-chain fatty acid transport protein